MWDVDGALSSDVRGWVVMGGFGVFNGSGGSYRVGSVDVSYEFFFPVYVLFHHVWVGCERVGYGWVGGS